VFEVTFDTSDTLVLLVVAATTDANLQHVGIIFVASEAISLVVLCVIIALTGWFDKYLGGLIGSCAIRVSGLFS
jgi:hypothetical protein